MTYNINYGFANPEAAVALLKESNADIICLQETNAHWESVIKPALGNRYRYIEFKNERAAGGLAVISKHPFTTKAVVQAERGWFPMWLLEFETDLGKCQVFNLHLKPGLNERGRIGCLGSAWFQSHKIHKEELELCLSKVDPELPVFLLGDINENDSNKGCRFLRKSGYGDALSLLPKSKKTWMWNVGAITLKGRYDHIFYNEKVKCETARIIYKGSSDHFPVVGRFSF